MAKQKRQLNTRWQRFRQSRFGHFSIIFVFLVVGLIHHLQLGQRLDNALPAYTLGMSEPKRVDTASYMHLADIQRNQSEIHLLANNPPNETHWLIKPTSTSNTRIPKTINKIYFQKNGRFDENAMSERLKWAHDTWPALNPGYEVRYFSLVLARKYLARHFHPVFLRTFDCIEAFAGKSDFFRMALLYREGGFHSDWKEACLEHGILESISSKTDFFAAVDFGFTYASVTRSCAQNAFVGSVPRHRIVAKYLELAMKNVQSSAYPENTLLATGPCLFGKAIKFIDEEFGTDEAIASGKYGLYKEHHFFWNDKKIVAHRCCGWGQHWENGNNYNILFQEKKYYCEDSAMILNDYFA